MSYSDRLDFNKEINDLEINDLDSNVETANKKRKPMMKMAADEEEEKINRVRLVSVSYLSVCLNLFGAETQRYIYVYPVFLQSRERSCGSINGY